MNGDIIKGFINPIILAVVVRGDAYGYEIAKYVNEQTDGALELKEGTLYPALRRLEAEKFIEGYWGTETEGPRRRYYRITKLGLAELKSSRADWLMNRRIFSLFLEEDFAL
ncbi:MAG: PadR family transcriptional regulator [Bacilli bacterium]